MRSVVPAGRCAAILAFAERVLPHASELWVQASPDQRQRLQQLFSLGELCSTENGLFEPGYALTRSST